MREVAIVVETRNRPRYQRPRERIYVINLRKNSVFGEGSAANFLGLNLKWFFMIWFK
jgi:hypothetical protein